MPISAIAPASPLSSSAAPAQPPPRELPQPQRKCKRLSENIANDMFPTPVALHPVLYWAIDNHFSAPAIERIIAHVNRYGSAVCCGDLEPSERDEVEALLPRSPLWDSPRWDSWEVRCVDASVDFDGVPSAV